MSDKTVKKISFASYLQDMSTASSANIGATAAATSSDGAKSLSEDDKPITDAPNPSTTMASLPTTSASIGTSMPSIQTLDSDKQIETDEEEEALLRKTLADNEAEIARLTRAKEKVDEGIALAKAVIMTKKVALARERRRATELNARLQQVTKEIVRYESLLKQENIKAEYEAKHVIEPNLKLIEEKTRQVLDSYRNDLEEECRLKQSISQLKLKIQDKKRIQASAAQAIKDMPHLQKYKDQLEEEVEQTLKQNDHLDEVNNEMVTKLRIEENRKKAKEKRLNNLLQRRLEDLAKLKEKKANLKKSKK